MAIPVFVQWTDAKAKEIAAVFGCPQDPDAYPNQGAIDSADARYATWFNTIPEGPSRLGLIVPDAAA